jgi:hypothetical protein
MMELFRNWLGAASRVFREEKSFRWPASSLTTSRLALRPVDMRCMARRAPLLLGWPGVVGIGLLTACCAFYFSTIQQAQAKLASTRHSALALQDQLKLAGHEANATQHTPEEQVSRFFKLFPQDKELPQCMEKIFASAQNQGIGLEQGDYKVVRDKEGGLVRFEMTFPVRGDYPRIRKYLTSLTADIPTLALQQVKFKRQKVGDAMVEANINLVLYLREQKS